MKKILMIVASAMIAIAGCKNETTINQDDASEVIAAHLENKPAYVTTPFRFGEIRFNSNKDRQELANYRELEDKGLIRMVLNEQKKRFLSKDSTFVFEISLTDKAAPLVLEQRGDKATVKAVTYVLDESKPVNFIKTNDKNAKVTVTLKQDRTDFYPFTKSGVTHSDFLNKTFRLRLKKDKGWEVVD